MGKVQGGILAAMLDDTMGPALIATLPPGHFNPTLEMKVSFFAPANVGPIWGRGRVVQSGRTNAFVEADLVDENERLIARGSATLRIITF
ncbi:MAG: PaaI family thioesterase [Mycobacteriales bacterium]